MRNEELHKVVELDARKNEIDPMKERRSRKKKNTHGGKFLVLLLFLGLILAGVLYILMDMAVIRDVLVTGNKHYESEEIIRMIDLKEDSNILDVYFMGEIDYTGYPYIKSVEINYEGLNIIRVIVKEKEVVSYIKYQSRYLALDKDAYVIDYLDGVSDVPLVEGLYIESAVIGESLGLDEAIVDALLSLHHLRKKYDVPISRIEFPYGDVTLLNVYIEDIKVVLGTLEDLDMKMKKVNEVIGEIPEGVSGTMDLQEDEDLIIFKKNKN